MDEWKQTNIQEAIKANINLNLNQNKQLTVRTAHKCVHITAYNRSTQHSTEQFR